MDLREVQTFAKMRGLYSAKVDGLWGPVSKAACAALILEQRIDPRAWPQGRLIIGANQVTLQLPYPMRIAWDVKTTINRTSCHKLLRPGLERVFKRTLDH